ncbi:hypothetical protein A2U01_0080590, partial [Trifolium medium]|nr:hypothetical protein [Trifolium medium]
DSEASNAPKKLKVVDTVVIPIVDEAGQEDKPTSKQQPPVEIATSQSERETRSKTKHDHSISQ